MLGLPLVFAPCETVMPHAMARDESYIADGHLNAPQGMYSDDVGYMMIYGIDKFLTRMYIYIYIH